MQVSITELANGELSAELLRPEHCSVEDQLYSAFIHDQRSTEAERLKSVRILRTVVSEKGAPGLRGFYREFTRLRLSPDLFAGLVLDARAYTLWVEVPLEELHLSTVTPDRSFAAWADHLIAALMKQPSVPVPPN